MCPWPCRAADSVCYKHIVCSDRFLTACSWSGPQERKLFRVVSAVQDQASSRTDFMQKAWLLQILGLELHCAPKAQSASIALLKQLLQELFLPPDDTQDGKHCTCWNSVQMQGDWRQCWASHPCVSGWIS